jgi:hypothetical protein
MNAHARILPLVAAGLLLAGPLHAQGPALAPQPDSTVDAATRVQVVDGVLEALREAYVFPDKAGEMEAAVRQRMRRGEYDRLTSARAFADSLTSHLRAVSRDGHLRVFWSRGPLPVPPTPDAPPPPEQLAQMREAGRRANWGFERVEWMQGNVGYLDVRGFFDAEGGAETAAAAMNFLANTDVLIVDVRQNGGGSPEMVQFVTSYLFGGEPVHLNSLYWRPRDATDQFWTLPYVPGRRFGPDKKVYVLTSDRTFSAAEEFTYNLQTRKRATVVGDTTGGGAHPGGSRRVSDHFGVWVPSGRAINPVTSTNWEGTGVRPDVPVPTDQALQVAYVAALRDVLAALADEQRRPALERLLAEQQKKLDDMRAAPPAAPSNP